LAVKIGAIATPLGLVWAVAVVDPAKVPLAPLPGAVNVTVTPLTGVPPLVTVACNAVPKAVVTAVLCPLPPLLVITDTAPAPPSDTADKCRFPLPDVIFHVTVSVCPAEAAWYVNV
jgi:hypothetical protein